MKTLSWVETEVKFKRKLNWWGQAAGVEYAASSWRGSSRIFFSFFFLRMILVSWGSVGYLCTVHSAFSGSAWYVLFILIWRIQGVTPSTLTALGVVRTTMYGPFHRGAKESCFQSLTHTGSPGTNSWIYSPSRNGTLSCTNLVTWFITLASCSICVKSHLPLSVASLLTPVSL